MRDIYQQAEQVVVWLGPEADESHLVFKHIERWRNIYQDYEANMSSTPPMYSGKTKDAFAKLCQRPWFFRSWVMQELCLARQAIVMCGPDIEDFHSLFLPSDYMLRDTYNPLQGIDGPGHYENLERIRWAQLRGGLTIKQVFQYSKSCEATNPKDKVYSLLGLFKWQIMPIDYGFDVARVYHMFTQAIIEHMPDYKLEVLHWMGASRERDNLPSWVPDFSVSRPLSILPWVPRIRQGHRGRPVAGLQFRASDLVLKGKHIETVHEVGPELYSGEADTPGSYSFSETLQNWEAKAAKLVHRKRFQNTVTNAFLVIIIADYEEGDSTEYPSDSSNFVAWYERYGTAVLEHADPIFFEEIAWENEWWTEEELEHDAQVFAQKVESVCFGRCFFTTDQGSMGLAPPRAKQGDELVYFPEAVYPFAVRGREDETYELVGDCFLYDFDAYKLLDDGAREMKEFVL